LGNNYYFSRSTKKINPYNETIRGEEFTYELRKVIRSYFPDLKQMLAQLPNTCKRKDYGCDELLYASLSILIFKVQSRNAFNNDCRQSSEFISNYQKPFSAKLPHLDAVHDFFETLPPGEPEKIKVDMVRRLITNKVFYR